MLLDPVKRIKRKTDLIFFGELAGYLYGQRLYRLNIFGRTGIEKRQLFLNNTRAFSALKFTDDQISTFLRRCSTTRHPKQSLGSHRGSTDIAGYLERHPEQLSPKRVSAIIASSEPLQDPTQRILTRFFDVPVVSRYGAQELGILAQQMPGSTDFLCNEHSFYFEIVDDQDRPVTEGQTGRVVVTDLWNAAMPLVRYDTGDEARLGNGTRGTFALSFLEGRGVDRIYDCDDRPVSPQLFYTDIFDGLGSLTQYQLTQRDAQPTKYS